jgi:acyl-CoA synthetase (AMP-forming)/AMP-acid ligase II
MTASATITSPETLGALFARTAVERRDESALRSDDGAIELSWGAYAAQARDAAAGLAGLGTHRGDTVACWLSNCPAFHIADAAALLLGAVPFSVYPTLTAAQAEHVIRDAGSRIVITEPAFLKAALALRETRRTALETIVLVDGADGRGLTWQELLSCAAPDFDPEAALAGASPMIAPR